MYRCSVNGVGATIWRGTLFDECLDGAITLLHSRFSLSNGSSTSTTRICGNFGFIEGQAVGTVNNTIFISRLTFTVNERMEGRSVECVYDDGSDLESIIGTSLVQLSTGVVKH